MTAKQFTKKPVTIEAIQFMGTPASANEVFDAFNIPGAKFVPDMSDLERGTLQIPTLEGDHTATAGDYIIKGVKGEFYPVKPDIFEMTYNAGGSSSEVNVYDFRVIEQGTQYLIPKYEVIDGIGIQPTENFEEINFVRGSKLKDETVERHEGILHEGLISMMLFDLRYKSSLVPSRESSLIITHLDEALNWMIRRGIERKKAGTQGTYKTNPPAASTEKPLAPSLANIKHIAISFTLKGQDFGKIRTQLEKIKAENPGPVMLMHGFLSRKVIQERGLPTDVVDALDELFPTQLNLSFVGGEFRNMMAYHAKTVNAKVYAIGEIKEGVADEVTLYESAGLTVEKRPLE